jgi:DDE family transposase
VKNKKATYRIRNWREYNAALEQRGSLTFWVSPEAINNWTTAELTGERGASPTYTDLAIETMATVQAIFHLPGRQTEGFLNSIFELMDIDLTAPDHTTLSRRRGKLSISLPVQEFARSRHVVVDSTGIKVYGEGEWKVRQHGISKRRTWRKLHLCVDEQTKEILSLCASTNDVSDSQMLPELLSGVPGKITQVSGDGAYDKRKCYEAINQHQAKAAIPPRKGAKIWQRANTKSERHARDENLRQIRKIGRKQWKQQCNYHRRSIAETTVFRYKVIIGDRLRTRSVENQFNEMALNCAILNRMTALGMPETYKVTG